MKTLFLSTLGKTINSYLLLDPASKQRLKPLQGHAITIELLPFHFIFQLSVNEEGVSLQPDAAIESAVTIRGTPLQMMGVMMEKEHRHRFFADDLVMEGNAEIGQQIIALFDEIEIDWEEHLSQLTGDVPAYHIGRFLRGVNKWFAHVDDTLSQDINEFVHEEAQWFPAREALQDFFQQIDALQMDVDRAEARLNLLNREVLS